MASQFPKPFRQYYVIHETISAILGKDSTAPIDEVAIRQALKDTEATVGRPRLSDQILVAGRHAPHNLTREI